MPADDGSSRRARPLTAPPSAAGTDLLEPGVLPDPGRARRHEARDPDPARLAFARPSDGTRVGSAPAGDRVRALGRRLGSVPGRELATGGAFTLLGVGLLLGWAVHVSWTPLLDLGLIVVGALLVVQARRSTVSRPLVALGVLLALISAATWQAGVTLDGGLGRRTFTPTTAAPASYQLGTGQLTIDLRDTPLSGDPLRVRAEVGVGRIVVRLPEAATVTTRAVAGGGASFVFGEKHGGPGVDEVVASAGRPDQRVELNLLVGIGSVEVRRG